MTYIMGVPGGDDVMLKHQGYVRAVKRAASELMEERFLLEEDAQRFINAAEASSILK